MAATTSGAAGRVTVSAAGPLLSWRLRRATGPGTEDTPAVLRACLCRPMPMRTSEP